MKNFWVFFILLLFVYVPASVYGLEIGAQLKDVLLEKGEPSSTIEVGPRRILTFADRSVVTFEGDKVISVSTDAPIPRSSAKPALRTSSSISQARGLVLNSALVGFLASLVLFKVFFSDFQDFFECVRYYLQPNWISLFRGEAAEDYWSTAKLFVWIAVSLAAGIAFYGYRGGTLDSLVSALNEFIHGR